MALWHASAGDNAQTDRARSGASAWRPALLMVAALYLALLAVYRETAVSLYEMWSSSNLYGHGMLILPSMLFLLWLRRERLAALQPQPSAVGLGMIGIAAVLWLLGEAASVNLLRHLALVSMLPGAFVAILGMRIARASALPLAYLLFAVPAGGELIPVLQDITGTAVAAILVASGIPALFDANFLVIPSGQFEIAEACAGARFLIATVAVAVFGCDILYRRIWKRAAFVAAAIVIAVIGNAIRAYLIVALADWRGLEAGIAFDHVTFGLVFLSAVLIILFAVGLLFKDGEPARVSTERLSRPGAVQQTRTLARSGGVAAFALVIAAIPYLAMQMTAPSEISEKFVLNAPIGNGAWRASSVAPVNWRPIVPGADAEFLQEYVSAAGRVTLHAAYFLQQRQGAEIVREGNKYSGGAPWREVASTGMDLHISGQDLRVPCSIIDNGNAQRLACHLFWVNGSVTGSALSAKYQQAVGRLTFGPRSAAVIAFSVDRTTAMVPAEQAIEDLLEALPPIALWFSDSAGAQ